MNKVLTRGIITIAAVNDGKDGHSLTAKAFIEGSYRNGRTKGVKSYVRVFYDGQEVKDFTVSYRYKGAGQADWVKPQTNKEDSWGDAQRDGSTIFVEYTVEYKGLKAVATGRLDNIQDGKDGKDGSDAVSYKLIPSKETVLAYVESNTHNKKVKVELKYFIHKTVGDVTTDVRLYDEGLTLRAYPDLGDLQASSGVYGFGPVIRTYDASEETFSVTLLKGNKILNIRTIPITMKPDLVYAFDDKLGEVRRKISTVDGKVNTFKATINETSSTVGNLEKEFTQIQQTSKEISMTVNNGTRPNLLWGSDLNLDGVDTTSKEAIEKRLGVGLNATKVDNTEWFEYLKGGGVGGADALKFKAMKDTSEFAGLYWEVLTGASHSLRLKPNTAYTLSAWIRTEFDKDAQGYSNFVFEAFKTEKEDSAQRVGKLSFKTASSWFEPINEWTRVSTTFTTEELLYGSVAMWMNGTKPATLYLCHPKLEEGKTATPWCAYDGTVEELLAGGFDIKNRKYTATADNFKVQNNKGEQTFFVDENGRINNGMLVSKLRLTEPTIITNKNYQEFCYKGKINGHDVLFLDLLKCGTLLVLKDVGKQLYLDLPSFKYFESYNDNTLEEKAKAQYDKMRYIGNTIILYNINSQIVFVSGVLKYKRMAGVKDMNYLNEFGFYTEERLPCKSSELACFECKFGITRPEGNQEWYNRQAGVYWEYCYVTTS